MTAAMLATMKVSPWLWVGFMALVPPLLGLELFLVPRHNPIPIRRALGFSVMWFVVGIAFAGVVWAESGDYYAAKYLTGFFVEKGLTIDQVLVFALVLRRFKAPRPVVGKVVFIALCAGLLLRIPFIAFGSYLGEVERPLVQLGIAALFGAAGAVLFWQRHHELDPLDSAIVRRLVRRDRVNPVYQDRDLVTRHSGRRLLTLAGLVLLVLLTADLFFAGTVPLAFAYSKPGFLVFASSAFAVLGFRSLFFLVDGLVFDTARLKVALAIVFWVVAADLILHQTSGSEPEWLVPIIGLVAIAVPMASAVRGIDREMDKEQAPAE